MQGASSHGHNSSDWTSLLQQLEQEKAELREELREAGEALQQERSKVKQLEGEVVAVDIVREGVGKELEKVCFVGRVCVCVYVCVCVCVYLCVGVCIGVCI